MTILPRASVASPSYLLRLQLTASKPRSTSFRATSALPTTTYPILKARSRQFSRMASQATQISTKDAPQPLGPYTQAIKTPGLIFVSGQIPINAEGNIIDGSIAEKTELVCKYIKAILEEAGSGMDKVVKTTVFLADFGDFAEMNGAYGKWFTSKPSRSTVAVKTLPKNSPVEIECVALP